MFVFHCGNTSAELIRNTLPAHSCSLPPSGQTCIPEGPDEASGPGLPVLAAGGGGRRVLRAVAAAAPAGRLALPGSRRPARAAEAGPRAHPRRARLHPLRALLSPSRGRGQRVGRREGGQRGPRARARGCSAPRRPQSASPPPTAGPSRGRGAARSEGRLASAPQQHRLQPLFPAHPPGCLRYLVSCNCLGQEKKKEILYIYHSLNSFSMSVMWLRDSVESFPDGLEK